MRYFFAIVLPPLAVLLCGKPFTAILNLILTCLGWIPGVVHALFVVKTHNEKKMLGHINKSIRKSSKLAHRDARKMTKTIRETK